MLIFFTLLTLVYSKDYVFTCHGAGRTGGVCDRRHTDRWDSCNKCKGGWVRPATSFFNDYCCTVDDQYLYMGGCQCVETCKPFDSNGKCTGNGYYVSAGFRNGVQGRWCCINGNIRWPWAEDAIAYAQSPARSSITAVDVAVYAFAALGVASIVVGSYRLFKAKSTEHMPLTNREESQEI